MKTGIYNGGACGMVQAAYLGAIDFSAAEAVKLENPMPKGFKLVGLVVDVKTAFNAASTNEIKLGTAETVEEFMEASEITANTAGAYYKLLFVDVNDDNCDIYATYAQTGTAATAGEANIYGCFVKIEV